MSSRVLRLDDRDHALLLNVHHIISVLQELFPGRELTRTLLSGVCFNMLTFAETAAAPAGGEALPDGLTLRALPAGGGGTKHDLPASMKRFV